MNQGSKAVAVPVENNDAKYGMVTWWTVMTIVGAAFITGAWEIIGSAM